MDAYVYHAALYCGECGESIAARLDAKGVDDTGDSDRYPQGPEPDGGGEADTPQHCDACGLFLENPLMDDGARYVAEAVAEGKKTAREQWAPFYAVGEG